MLITCTDWMVERDIPNFIIAGPPRSGTGWMMSCLAEHPGVFIPEQEIHYFSENYEHSPSWYTNHFEGRSAEVRVGEKSPSYFANSDAAARIYRWNSDIHLVFSLRHPIERTYAMYCMMLRRGYVSEDVESELAPGKWLVRPSLYSQHLRAYRNQFSDEQLHVLIFDDLKESPQEFARNLFDIIGVNAEFKPSLLNQKFGHRKKRGGLIWSAIRSLSVQVSESSEPANGVIQWFRKSGYTDWIHQLRPGKSDPPIPSSTRRELHDYYKEDVNKLRAYLGRDLPSWPG
jgi:hypothetical protein